MRSSHAKLCSDKKKEIPKSRKTKISSVFSSSTDHYRWTTGRQLSEWSRSTKVCSRADDGDDGRVGGGGERRGGSSRFTTTLHTNPAVSLPPASCVMVVILCSTNTRLPESSYPFLATEVAQGALHCFVRRAPCYHERSFEQGVA